MLKAGSGRKVDDDVWKFLTNEPASDKCICTVSLNDECGDSGGAVKRCGAVIKGKTRGAITGGPGSPTLNSGGQIVVWPHFFCVKNR